MCVGTIGEGLRRIVSEETPGHNRTLYSGDLHVHSGFEAGTETQR